MFAYSFARSLILLVTTVSCNGINFYRFDAVIHFAGLKAVGESVQKPLLYFDNNLIGTIVLFEVMATHGCKKVRILVFELFASTSWERCQASMELLIVRQEREPPCSRSILSPVVLNGPYTFSAVSGKVSSH